ncbi:MAG: methyltransferase type 11 [Nitrospinae bacterium CG11_big_fil_rev_8_21_14_0_20_56_8]|nr:MAG: methyltransferase type 11 [Nitrospinae bacterium CG11_big_fil_rev_8_21_14_0_20_56_8]
MKLPSIVPPRNLREELLDIDQAPFEEVKESLRDVRRVNRYLGGYRVLLHHTARFLRDHEEPRPFRILDLATGSADQPVAIARMARGMRIPVRITAVDVNIKMLRYAAEETRFYPEIELAKCDILSLPFREGAFDLVVNSLSLHHFSRENAVVILRAAFRACRRGFIINDLHRSYVAHASIVLLTRLFTQNRLTRYDAPVSVMNAFTPAEMIGLADEAGIARYEIHRHFPYRIALVGFK